MQMADRNERAQIRGDQQVDDIKKQIRGEKSAQDSIKLESKFGNRFFTRVVILVKVTKEQTRVLIAENTKIKEKLTEELRQIEQKIRVQTIVQEN